MYNLYLKEHNITGMKYLGYTKREDYDIYTGSGKRWLRHISKHGYDVTTTLLGSYESEEDLKENGIKYSLLWNVVDNEDFANLKTEEGVSGIYGKEARKKMSESAKKRGAPATAWTSTQVSEMNKKTWQNPEIRQKRIDGIRKSLTGKKYGPRSQEFKDRMREVLTGRSYGKGIKHNLKEKTCPHCGKVGKGPNMTRYHFNNCKLLGASNPFGEI
jgi:hypothetical protein